MKSKAVQQQQQQYVGLNVHKKSIQVAVMNKNRRILRNTKISNKESEIKKMFAKKRGRSKTAVAAASKLLRISYWMLKKEMTFKQCIGDMYVK